MTMNVGKFVPDHRRVSYKNKDRFNPGELRRRRDVFQVKLRKERQFQILDKRRYIDSSGTSSSSSQSHGSIKFNQSGYYSESDDDENGGDDSPHSLQLELEILESDLTNSYDLQDQLGILVKIRQLISRDANLNLTEATLDTVFKFMLNYKLPMLQFEALWIITNLSAGKHEIVTGLVKRNIITMLVKLLEQGNCNMECEEQIIWAMGNIAGDCPEYRKLVYEEEPGMINLFIRKVLHQEMRELNGNPIPISTWKIISWTVSNLMRAQNLSQLDQQFMRMLQILLDIENEEVISNTCWVLIYMYKTNLEMTLTLLLKSDLIPKLIEILHNSEAPVNLLCLKILGNITTGSDQDTQLLLDNNILPILKELLIHMNFDDTLFLKQILWIISNIVAGTKNQVKQVLQYDIIPKIVEYLKNDSYDIKKEASWIFCNIISHQDLDVEIFQYMIAHSFMEPLFYFLEHADPFLQLIILNTFEVIFRLGQMEGESTDMSRLAFNKYSNLIEEKCRIDILINMHISSDNSEVSNKAGLLLDSYFHGG